MAVMATLVKDLGFGVQVLELGFKGLGFRVLELGQLAFCQVCAAGGIHLYTIPRPLALNATHQTEGPPLF